MSTRLLVPFLIAVCWSPTTKGALPVEGDLQALQLVCDVQAQNATAFPTGEAVFVAVDRFTFQVGREGQTHQGRQTWSGKVLWQGEKSYWEYRDIQEQLDDEGRWVESEEARTFRLIRTPQEEFSYFHECKYPGASQRFGDMTRSPTSLIVLPQDGWYGLGAPKVFCDWLKLINPSSTDAKVEKLLVTRPDPDLIVVERCLKSGSRFVMTFSLTAGGNLVRYEHPRKPDADPPQPRWGELDTFEWLPVGDGQFRLKQLERGSTNPKSPRVYYSLQISDFNPNPTISNDRFRFESLQVPDGTILRVDNRGVRSESVLGKPASTVNPAVLDALAEEAQTRGFAKPEP